MKVFTVQLRDANTPVPNEVEFVKEGFCWPALFIPLLWMLYRKQWLGILAYVAGSLVLGGVAFAIGASDAAQAILTVLFAFLVALHANDWRRWRLEAAGYRLIDVVAAEDLDHAEARWFAHRTGAASGVGAGVDAVTTRSGRGRPASPLTPFATPFDPV